MNSLRAYFSSRIQDHKDAQRLLISTLNGVVVYVVLHSTEDVPKAVVLNHQCWCRYVERHVVMKADRPI